jgi:hypothetical protein
MYYVISMGRTGRQDRDLIFLGWTQALKKGHKSTAGCTLYNTGEPILP